MRKRIARWLRRVARWLDTERVGAVQEAAISLVKAAEIMAAKSDGVSGEYKRHIVYAELQKQFPKARRRNLSLILESAVQAVKGD